MMWLTAVSGKKNELMIYHSIYVKVRRSIKSEKIHLFRSLEGIIFVTEISKNNMQDLHDSFKSCDFPSRSGCCSTSEVEDESLLSGYDVNHHQMVNAEQLHLLSERKCVREKRQS